MYEGEKYTHYEKVYVSFELNHKMLSFGEFSKKQISVDEFKEDIEVAKEDGCLLISLDSSCFAMVEIMRQQYGIEAEIPKEKPEVFLEEGCLLLIPYFDQTNGGFDLKIIEFYCQ